MPKRQRSRALSATNKRAKKSNEFDLGDDSGIYEVADILDERKGEYLISWAPHPRTGEEYTPSWTPKVFVNRLAVDHWKETKRRRKAQEQSLRDRETARHNRPERETPSHYIPRARGETPPDASVKRAPKIILRLRPKQSSGQTEIDETHESAVNNQSALTTSTSEPPDSRIQIEVAPISASQRALYSEGYFSDFRSSQVISGTAPEQDSGSRKTESNSYGPVDAAAAPNLTQDHSEYEDIDTPRSTSISSTSNAGGSDAVSTQGTDPSSSASVHQELLVEDSQSAPTTLLYISSQTNSGSTNERSVHSNIVVACSQEVEDISDPSIVAKEPQLDPVSRSQPSQSDPIVDTQSGVVPTSSEPAIADQPIYIPSSGQVVIPASSPENTDAGNNLFRPSSPPIDSPRDQAVGVLASPFRARSQLSSLSTAQAVSRVTDSASALRTQISPNFSHLSSHDSRRQQPDRTSDLLDAFNRARNLTRRHTVVNSVETSLGSLQGPPSQWPDTFHSAPARPYSISDLPTTPVRNMSPASPPSAESEQSQKIQEIVDAGGIITPAQRSLGMTTRSSANRASSPSVLREARSPSAVPNAEFVPMPTEEENRTSERYLTLFPDRLQDATGVSSSLPAGITDDASIDGRSDAGSQVDQPNGDSSAPAPRMQGPMEFAIPVFFPSQQRDTYKQSIVWEKEFLNEFVQKAWSEDSPMISRAKKLLLKLRQITSHPDLMNEESFTQQQTEPTVKAQWDRNCSVKFRFIAYLISELADQNVHIVIDIDPGRLLDTMDNFLTGLEVQHVKAGTEAIFTSPEALRVTLLPKTSSAAGLSPADVVIGFEGSIELIEDHRRALRSHSDGTTAPLLYLVIPKTVEHIERYMSKAPYASLSPAQRTTLLVENAAHLRLEAGFRQIQDQDSGNLASSIAKFLIDGCLADEWPVDGLADLTIKSSSSESQATTASAESAIAASKTNKRPLDDDSGEENGTKKLRVHEEPEEMPSTIDPSSMNLTAMTDSMERQELSASEYASDLAALQQAHEEREAILRKQVAAMQQRLDEHVTALEELQYRHEDQRAELVKAISDRDEAYQSASVAASRVASRDTLVTKLRAEKDGFAAQLAETTAALASHTVPEIAEFQALKQRTAEAEAERDKVLTKNENVKKELEYIRGLYQEISSRGAQIAEEKAELEAKTGELEQRASGAVAQARALANDKTNKQLMEEIKRLRAKQADYERVMGQRDEELARLREKERGRMGTRGASVPRSPGLASPMRLEPPRSSAVGSRAASPRRGSPAAAMLGGGNGKSRLGR